MTERKVLSWVCECGERNDDDIDPTSEPVTQDGPLGGFATLGRAAAELDLLLTQFQMHVDAYSGEDTPDDERENHSEQALQVKREIIEKYTPRVSDTPSASARTLPPIKMLCIDWHMHEVRIGFKTRDDADKFYEPLKEHFDKQDHATDRGAVK